MMYLFGMEDARAAQQERLRRARLRRMRRSPVIDSFVRPRQDGADVIELAFGHACDRDRIGA